MLTGETIKKLKHKNELSYRLHETHLVRENVVVWVSNENVVYPRATTARLQQLVIWLQRMRKTKGTKDRKCIGESVATQDHNCKSNTWCGIEN
jgi:hypothetical protein